MEQVMGNEWQTAALWCVLGFLGALLLWRVHISNNEKYAKFDLIDLVAEDGKLSSTKFMSFIAFVVATFGTIVCTIRGEVPAEFVGLLSLYAGVYTLNRLGNQKIGTEAAMMVQREQIRRGRRTDPILEETVEEEDLRLKRNLHRRLLDD